MKKTKALVLIFLFFFTLTIAYGKSYLQDPAFVYKARGDNYRRIGQLGLAIGNYEKALAIKKDYSDCNFWIASILSQKQLYVQALYKVNLALYEGENKFSSKSLYYSALFLEIDIYFMRGESKDAIKIIDKLSNILSKLQTQRNQLGIEFKPYLKYQLGKCYYYKGKLFYTIYKGKTMFASHVLQDRDEKEIPSFFDKAISNNYKPDIAYYYKYLFYKSKAKETIKKLNNEKDISFIESLKQQYKFYTLNSSQAIKKAITINPNIILDFKQYEN